MMQKQEPLRHHFLPVFFLKKWAGTDGRLVEFSKPYKNIVRPRRTHPKGTGFIDRLYAIEGFAGELSYEVERSFLSPVDSRASTALEAMVAGNQPSPAERDAWARFMMSLLMRMPTEINLLKGVVQDIDRRIAGGIGQMLLRHVPVDYHGAIEQAFVEYKREAQERLTQNIMRVLSSDDIVPLISAMHWDLIDLAASPNELLVSDRPVIVHRDALPGSETTIALPVGPRNLFVAATKPGLLAELRRVPPKKITSSVNADIVAGASRLIYGNNDRQLAFIQNRMGTNNEPSIVATILFNAGLDVAHYTETIASFEDDDLRNRVVAAITEHQHHDAVQPLDLRLAPALSTRSSNKSLDD
ncbi:hypothetical protein M2418_003666 [Rhizobium sp. BIGb0125]|uniref:DUF4238 domain-containing protein n=1 Tax=Rhizobium sp. BIGb0125 TaxID=2940618 RepID=UPI0021685EF4|nr:DUF4238 domain-containing protein [Rhizobium sp. BIGb0125]MCS4244125.1 hypothetical protein [Rhizobium sp. BIGb0125]